MNQITDVVKNLIIINVIMFLGTSMLPYEWQNWLSLHLPLSDYFKPFQLVSHMFMHYGVFHIAFNMYGLYLFGSALESLWGPKRFFAYYFFTGFGAVILYLIVQYIELQYYIGDIDPNAVKMVIEDGGKVLSEGKNYSNYRLADLNRIINLTNVRGASGAIFGLLAGFGLNFPNNRLGIFPFPFMIEAKYFVLIYGSIELYLGISGFNTGIAHFAHLGGALFGFLLIRYWQKYGSNL